MSHITRTFLLLFVRRKKFIITLSVAGTDRAVSTVACRNQTQITHEILTCKCTAARAYQMPAASCHALVLMQAGKQSLTGAVSLAESNRSKIPTEAKLYRKLQIWPRDLYQHGVVLQKILSMCRRDYRVSAVSESGLATPRASPGQVRTLEVGRVLTNDRS